MASRRQRSQHQVGIAPAGDSAAPFGAIVDSPTGAWRTTRNGASASDRARSSLNVALFAPGTASHARDVVACSGRTHARPRCPRRGRSRPGHGGRPWPFDRVAMCEGAKSITTSIMPRATGWRSGPSPHCNRPVTSRQPAAARRRRGTPGNASRQTKSDSSSVGSRSARP